MKPQRKAVDTFQIVGFILSISISIELIAMGQNTVASVTLGLVLSTLTQFLDLQPRQAASEDRLMRAQVLSQVLFRDEWLHEHVQQMVDDYATIKGGWFELFKRRAEDAVAMQASYLPKLKPSSREESD
jgi:hypothetical protein